MTPVLIFTLAAAATLSQYYLVAKPGMQAPGSQSILQVKGDNVRVRLLDAFSGEAIANSEVDVQSDNGIRCVRPPCPTNHSYWKGTTDDQGYVLVPARILQQVPRINTPNHEDGRDLVRDAESDAAGAWVAELLPNHVLDGPNLGSRAIKLIDAQTNRAITNATARVSFGDDETLELKTNALGYIFIPLEKADEDTWVNVPGYKRDKIDFAAVRYKTRLKRQ